MQTIVLASGNPGKLDEILAYVEPLKLAISWINKSDLGVGDIDETGLTFVENALLKARHAAQLTGHAALGDDSGLVIDALGGEPGIRSARYAGIPVDFERNIDKVLQAMQTVDASQRTAYFCCVMAFVRSPNDPYPIISSGVWHGHIALERVGCHGFGYDPIFIDQQTGKTAAELPSEDKLVRSHRGQALDVLVKSLKNHLCTMDMV
jgi:XTP/dITP diphosphohydrolase